MNIIWATRGRTWGFRFLRTGGLGSPIEVYEDAFVGTEGAPVAFEKRAETVAVRFPDPDGRMDRAGRVIPHEFVILSADADSLRNVEDARAVLWPMVREEYEAIWDQPTAPALGTSQPR